MTAPAGLSEETARLTELALEHGLRIMVVPADEPPLAYGTAVRVDLGVTRVPAALTMTWIESAGAGQDAEIEQRGAAVVEELAAGPGFIGFVGTTFAGRGHTFAAWTTPAAAESAVTRSRSHREARDQFLRGPLGQRGFTSIWVPHRLNPQHLRCPGCGERHALRPGATTVRCRCGAEPGVVSYF